MSGNYYRTTKIYRSNKTERAKENFEDNWNENIPVSRREGIAKATSI